MYTPFKDKELRVMVFKIRLDTTGNVTWESTVVAVSHLVHYNTLLQNATDFITKWDSYFITKRNKSLLQNASTFLSQNATVLLQKATVFTKHNNFIAKCNSYYKMHQHRLEHSFSL